MSVRALKTLLAVHDRRSFQAAARQLNMTLSAVSMQMKQLEETYDAVLFDRSRRPPSLTRAGVMLAEASRSIVTGYDDLSVLMRSASPLRGKLTLGIIATASIRLLPVMARLLVDQCADLRLRVESGLSAELAERVASGKLDAAVVTETAGLSHEFAVTAILREPLVLVAAKSERRRLSIDLLRNRPFIRFQPQTGIGQLIDQFLRSSEAAPREIMVLDSLEAIVELVALDMGVTIIPEPEAVRYGRGRVAWTADLGRPLSRTLALITRRSAGSLGLHRALLDVVGRALSDDNPLLATAGARPNGSARRAARVK